MYLTVRIALTTEAAMSEPKPKPYAKPKMSAEERKARRHAERAIGRKLPAILHCSFCGKSQRGVEKLIAGPRGVFICNECVGLCEKIVAGTWTPADAKGFEPLKQPTDELL